MKKYFLIFISLLLVTIFINPVSRNIILYKIFKLNNHINTFNVGKIELYMDNLNRNREISIWGYLVEKNGAYFLVSNKSFSNIKYRYRPRETVIINGIEKTQDFKLNENCINKYVESKGFLEDLPRNQMSLLYSFRLKFMHTIEGVDITCNLPNTTNTKDSNTKDTHL